MNKHKNANQNLETYLQQLQTDNVGIAIEHREITKGVLSGSEDTSLDNELGFFQHSPDGVVNEASAKTFPFLSMETPLQEDKIDSQTISYRITLANYQITTLQKQVKAIARQTQDFEIILNKRLREQKKRLQESHACEIKALREEISQTSHHVNRVRVVAGNTHTSRRDQKNIDELYEKIQKSENVIRLLIEQLNQQNQAKTDLEIQISQLEGQLSKTETNLTSTKTRLEQVSAQFQQDLALSSPEHRLQLEQIIKERLKLVEQQQQPLSQPTLDQTLVLRYSGIGDTGKMRLKLLFETFQAFIEFNYDSHLLVQHTNFSDLSKNKSQIRGILLLGLEQLLFDGVELILENPEVLR